MIHVGGKVFALVKEHKSGYNFEAFRDRYSDVLDRYDYIVGDWGYNQLRLKGFFKEGSNKANKETSIASLEDYINEYCNFGCAYFVLERVGGKDQPDSSEKNSHEHRNSKGNADSRNEPPRQREHRGRYHKHPKREPKESRESRQQKGPVPKVAD